MRSGITSIKIGFFLLLCLSLCSSHAQEICNNGIDDDGDGKIDLQDENCVNGVFTWSKIRPLNRSVPAPIAGLNFTTQAIGCSLTPLRDLPIYIINAGTALIKRLTLFNNHHCLPRMVKASPASMIRSNMMSMVNTKSI